MTSTQVGSSGVRLQLSERGPADAPTVVLVHGYPDTLQLWDDVVAVLADELRVVVYDVRGAGRSTAPADRSGYAMSHLLDDLRAVLDAVAPTRRVHLVGHDWGAIQGFAAASDESLSPRLASFTAIAAPGLGTARAWVARRLAEPSPRHLVELAGQLGRSWYLAAFQVPVLPELALRTMGDLPIGTGGVEDAVRGLGLYRANRSGEATRAPVPTGLPVRIIAGRRDPFVSPRVFDDLASLPHVTVTEVDGGHWLPRTHPERVARHVRDLVTEVEAGADG
ncbi:MAG: alpha/beta fold hydrolase [Nitriliruptor sp.]|uniref:alpha/beta fold hydrolase n=1 Tax=Nitriliruptor sp. TaxID=2448056 RepID=UPI0034A08373